MDRMKKTNKFFKWKALYQVNFASILHCRQSRGLFQSMERSGDNDYCVECWMSGILTLYNNMQLNLYWYPLPPFDKIRNCCFKLHRRGNWYGVLGSQLEYLTWDFEFNCRLNYGSKTMWRRSVLNASENCTRSLQKVSIWQLLFYSNQELFELNIPRFNLDMEKRFCSAAFVIHEQQGGGTTAMWRN